MGTNIVTSTEDFSHSDWTLFDGIVIANTDAAPGFAGINGTPADTLGDDDAVNQGSIYSTYRTIPDDTQDWITSLFVKKIDSPPTAYCELVCQFTGGTGFGAGISFDPFTGSVSEAFAEGTATSAKGCVDFDPLWWRFWFRLANNGTGNNLLRMGIFPGRASTLGGSQDGSRVGRIAGWGANQTNDSTIQTYQPDPSYTLGQFLTGNVYRRQIG